MPILSGSMAELAEELKQFEKDNKAAVDKVTAGLAAFDEKHQQALARLDSVEERQRQLPARELPPGGQLMFELLHSRALIERPKSLGRGQSIRFEISTKNIVMGISRQIPYQTGIVAPGPAPALPLRALIPQIPITAGAVQYTRETALVNNAAPVAEGAAKPESDVTYTPVTAPVETIATWTKISTATYDDLPALATALENRLVYALMAKEENQLLNGSGVTPQLTGFMTVAPAAPAPTTGQTLVDVIALAASAQTTAGYPVTAAVVNPNDWTTALLQKDTLNQYIQLPVGVLPPIVTCPAMAAGKWLVGAFTTGCTLFERQDATIQIASQNVDDFTKNLLTILVELREVLAIYQSAAFLQGVVPAVTATRL